MRGIWTWYFSVVGWLVSAGAVGINCPKAFIAYLGQGFGLSQQAVVEAVAFADAHKLPYQVVRVGDDEYPEYRLFVALDVAREGVLEQYMQQFNFSSNRGGIGGYIAVESRRSEDEFGASNFASTPSVRIHGTPLDTVWSARANTSTWTDYHRGNLNRLGGMTFDFLIPLSGPRREQVNAFLARPEDWLATISHNCTSWISCIETANVGGSAELDRHFLAHYLGFRRTIEHDELSRRLTHVANPNLPVVFVIYSSAVATLPKTFFQKILGGNNLQPLLPPLPKKAFRDVKLAGVHSLRREVTAALEHVPLGARVFIPIAAGGSSEAFRGLYERAIAHSDAQPFEVSMTLNGISTELVSSFSTVGRIRSFFVGRNLREMIRNRAIEWAPIFLGQMGQLIRARHPDFAFEAALVRVSPPDSRGRYSLGPNHDHTMDVIRNNPGIVVIAEINANVPHTTGDNFLTAEEITASFEGKDTLMSPAEMVDATTDPQIAQHLASLIPQGATLQLGIGRIFSQLPDALLQTKVSDLTIWSEVFGDVLMELLKRKIANQATTGFAYGSPELYRWLGNNPKVTFQAFADVNNVARIAAIPNFHAINTAFEVDLDGQSNAIFTNGFPASSPGGQVEYMLGATHSLGGKSIFALRSTVQAFDPASNARVPKSTISGFLHYGPVTTPASSVTHVVTEHGIAQLVGKTRSQRALALIAIAAPEFRAGLLRNAVKNGQLPQADAAAAAAGLGVVNWRME